MIATEGMKVLITTGMQEETLGEEAQGGGESVAYFATTTSKEGKSAVAEEVDGGKLICNLSGKYKFLFSWSSGG
jgi:hypothetical protein